MGFFDKITKGVSEAWEGTKDVVSDAGAKVGEGAKTFKKAVGLGAMKLGNATGFDSAYDFGASLTDKQSISNLKYAKRDAKDNIALARSKQEGIGEITDKKKGLLSAIKKQYGSGSKEYWKAVNSGVSSVLKQDVIQNYYNQYDKSLNKSLQDNVSNYDKLSAEEKLYIHGQDEYMALAKIQYKRSVMNPEDFNKRLEESSWATDIIEQQNRRREGTYSVGSLVGDFAKAFIQPVESYGTALGLKGTASKESKLKTIQEYGKSYGFQKMVDTPEAYLDGNESLVKDYFWAGGAFDLIPAVGALKKGGSALYKSAGKKLISKGFKTVLEKGEVSGMKWLGNLKADKNLSKLVGETIGSKSFKSIEHVLDGLESSPTLLKQVLGKIPNTSVGIGKGGVIGGLKKLTGLGGTATEKAINNALSTSSAIALKNAKGGAMGLAKDTLKSTLLEGLNLDAGSFKFMAKQHTIAAVSNSVFGVGNSLTDIVLNPGGQAFSIVDYLNDYEVAKQYVDPDWKKTYGAIPKKGDKLYDMYMGAVGQVERKLQPHEVLGMTGDTWFDKILQTVVDFGANTAVTIGGINAIRGGYKLGGQRVGNLIGKDGTFIKSGLNKVVVDLEKSVADKNFNNVSAVINLFKKEIDSKDFKVGVIDGVKLSKMFTESYKSMVDILETVDATSLSNKDRVQELMTGIKSLFETGLKDKESISKMAEYQKELSDINIGIISEKNKLIRGQNLDGELALNRAKFDFSRAVLQSMYDSKGLRNTFNTSVMNQLAPSYFSYAGLGEGNNELAGYYKTYYNDVSRAFDTTRQAYNVIGKYGDFIPNVMKVGAEIQTKIEESMNNFFADSGYDIKTKNEFIKKNMQSVTRLVYNSILAGGAGAKGYGSKNYKTDGGKAILNATDTILNKIFKIDNSGLGKISNFYKQLEVQDGKVLNNIGKMGGKNATEVIREILMLHTDDTISKFNSADMFLKFGLKGSKYNDLYKKYGDSIMGKKIVNYLLKNNAVKDIPNLKEVVGFAKAFSNLDPIMDSLLSTNKDALVRFVKGLGEGKTELAKGALLMLSKGLDGKAKSAIDGLKKALGGLNKEGSDGARVFGILLSGKLAGLFGKQVDVDVLGKGFDAVFKFSRELTSGMSLRDFFDGVDSLAKNKGGEVLKSVISKTLDGIHGQFDTASKFLGKDTVGANALKAAAQFYSNKPEDVLKQVTQSVIEALATGKEIDFESVKSELDTNAKDLYNMVGDLMEEMMGLAKLNQNMQLLNTKEFIDGTDKSIGQLLSGMSADNIKKFMGTLSDFVDTEAFTQIAKGDTDVDNTRRLMKEGLETLNDKLKDLDIGEIDGSTMGKVLSKINDMVDNIRTITGTKAEPVDILKQKFKDVAGIIKDLVASKDSLDKFYDEAKTLTEGDALTKKDRAYVYDKILRDDVKLPDNEMPDKALVVSNVEDLFLTETDTIKNLGVENKDGVTIFKDRGEMQVILNNGFNKISTEELYNTANTKGVKDFDTFVDTMFNTMRIDDLFTKEGLDVVKKEHGKQGYVLNFLKKAYQYGSDVKVDLRKSDSFDSFLFSLKSMYNKYGKDYGDTVDASARTMVYNDGKLATLEQYNKDNGSTTLKDYVKQSVGIKNVGSENFQYVQTNVSFDQLTDLNRMPTETINKMIDGNVRFDEGTREASMDKFLKQITTLEENGKYVYLLTGSDGGVGVRFPTEDIKGSLLSEMNKLKLGDSQQISIEDRIFGQKGLDDNQRHIVYRTYAFYKSLGLLSDPSFNSKAFYQKFYDALSGGKNNTAYQSLLKEGLGLGGNSQKYMGKVFADGLQVKAKDIGLKNNFNMLVFKDNKQSNSVKGEDTTDSIGFLFGKLSDKALELSAVHTDRADGVKVGFARTGGIGKSEYRTRGRNVDGVMSLVSKDKVNRGILINYLREQGYTIADGVTNKVLARFIGDAIESDKLVGIQYESAHKDTFKDIRSMNGISKDFSIRDTYLNGSKPIPDNNVVEYDTMVTYGSSNEVSTSDIFGNTQKVSNQLQQNLVGKVGDAFNRVTNNLIKDKIEGYEQIRVALVSNDTSTANRIFKDVFARSLSKDSPLTKFVEQDGGIQNVSPTDQGRVLAMIAREVYIAPMVAGTVTKFSGMPDHIISEISKMELNGEPVGNLFKVVSRKHYLLNDNVSSDVYKNASYKTIVDGDSKSTKIPRQSGDIDLTVRYPAADGNSSLGLKVIFIEDLVKNNPEVATFFKGADGEFNSNLTFVPGNVIKLFGGDFDGDPAYSFPTISKSMVKTHDGIETDMGSLIAEFNTKTIGGATGKGVKADFQTIVDAYGKDNVEKRGSILGQANFSMNKAQTGTNSEVQRATSMLKELQYNVDYMSDLRTAYRNYGTGDLDFNTLVSITKDRAYTEENDGRLIEWTFNGSGRVKAAVDGDASVVPEDVMVGLLAPYKQKFGKIFEGAEGFRTEVAKNIANFTMTFGSNRIFGHKEAGRSFDLLAYTNAVKQGLYASDVLTSYNAFNRYLETIDSSELKSWDSDRYAIEHISVYKNVLHSRVSLAAGELMNGKYKDIVFKDEKDKATFDKATGTFLLNISNANTVRKVRENLSKYGNILQELGVDLNTFLPVSKHKDVNDVFAHFDNKKSLENVEFYDNPIKSELASYYSKIDMTDTTKPINRSKDLGYEFLNKKMTSAASTRASFGSELFINKMGYTDDVKAFKGVVNWSGLKDVFNESFVQISSKGDKKGVDAVVEKVDQLLKNGGDNNISRARGIVAYAVSFYGIEGVGKRFVEYVSQHKEVSKILRQYENLKSSFNNKGGFNKLFDERVNKVLDADVNKHFTSSQADKYKKAILLGDIKTVREVENDVMNGVNKVTYEDLADTGIKYDEFAYSDAVVKSIGDTVRAFDKDLSNDVNKYKLVNDVRGAVASGMDSYNKQFTRGVKFKSDNSYTNPVVLLMKSAFKLTKDGETRIGNDPEFHKFMNYIRDTINADGKYNNINSTVLNSIIVRVGNDFASNLTKGLTPSIRKDYNTKSLYEELLSKGGDINKTFVGQMKKLASEIQSKSEEAGGELLRKSTIEFQEDVHNIVMADDNVKKKMYSEIGKGKYANLTAKMAVDAVVKDVFMSGEGGSNLTTETKEGIREAYQNYMEKIGKTVGEHFERNHEFTKNFGEMSLKAKDVERTWKMKIDEATYQAQIKSNGLGELFMSELISNLNSIYKSSVLGLAGGRFFMEGANASIMWLTQKVAKGVTSKRSFKKEYGFSPDIKTDTSFLKIVNNHWSKLTNKLFKVHDKAGVPGLDSPIAKLSHLLNIFGEKIGGATYEYITDVIRDRYFDGEMYRQLDSYIRTVKDTDVEVVKRLFKTPDSKLTGGEKLSKSRIINIVTRKAVKEVKRDFFDYSDNPLFVSHLENYVPFMNFFYNNVKIMSSNPLAWAVIFQSANTVMANWTDDKKFEIDEDQFKMYFDRGGLAMKLGGLMGYGTMRMDVSRLSPISLGVNFKGYPRHALFVHSHDPNSDAMYNGDLNPAMSILKKTIPPVYDLISGDPKRALSRAIFMASGMPIRDESMKGLINDYFEGDYDSMLKYGDIAIQQMNSWYSKFNPDFKGLTKERIQAMKEFDDIMGWKRGDKAEYLLKKGFVEAIAKDLDIPYFTSRNGKKNFEATMGPIYDYVMSEGGSDFDATKYFDKLEQLNTKKIGGKTILAHLKAGGLLKKFTDKVDYKLKNRKVLEEYYYGPLKHMNNRDGDDSHTLDYAKQLAFRYKFEDEERVLLGDKIGSYTKKYEAALAKNEDYTVEDYLGTTEYLERKVKAINYYGTLTTPLRVKDTDLIMKGYGFTKSYREYLTKNKGELMRNFYQGLEEIDAYKNMNKLWLNKYFDAKKAGKKSEASFSYKQAQKYNDLLADTNAYYQKFDPMFYEFASSIRELKSDGMSKKGGLMELMKDSGKNYRNVYNKNKYKSYSTKYSGTDTDYLMKKFGLTVADANEINTVKQNQALANKGLSILNLKLN